MNRDMFRHKMLSSHYTDYTTSSYIPDTSSPQYKESHCKFKKDAGWLRKKRLPTAADL